jgi:hypothetical protein
MVQKVIFEQLSLDFKSLWWFTHKKFDSLNISRCRNHAVRNRNKPLPTLNKEAQTTSVGRMWNLEFRCMQSRPYELTKSCYNLWESCGTFKGFYHSYGSFWILAKSVKTVVIQLARNLPSHRPYIYR